MPRKRPLIASEEDLIDLLSGSRYHQGLLPASSIPLVGTKREIRRRIRSECPPLPGVYAYADEQGQVIYVGMSKCLNKRLLTYFSSKVRGKKEVRIGRHARRLVWQPVIHELVAWLRERELIRRLRPNFNVQGHPTRMKLGYIVLGRHDAPSFQLQPKIPISHSGVWGPIPMTRYTRLAVEELNHEFQLRDCPKDTPMVFRGEEALFDLGQASPCLRADFGTCLAPCLGECSRRKYSAAIKAGRVFLEGNTEPTLHRLRQQMEMAVESRHYEKAARLRDRLQALSRLDLHLRRFHDWRSQANFVYPVSSMESGEEFWVVIVRGETVAIVPRPFSREDRIAVGRCLRDYRQHVRGTQGQPTLTGPDEFESARLNFRWFRLNSEEKDRRLTLGAAVRQCRVFSKRGNR
ncbi:MAG: UvrB/UvrC motif-containing protein [Planctomycetaceae bacterium]|nr:UvrB/UvrC motif-containing protein [Planctomycetaceae bacterium]